MYLPYNTLLKNLKRIDNQNSNVIHFKLFIASMQFMKT